MLILAFLTKNEKCSPLIAEYKFIIVFVTLSLGLRKSFKKWLLTPWVMSDSPEYDTPGRLTLRSMIPLGDFYENLNNPAKS